MSKRTYAVMSGWIAYCRQVPGGVEECRCKDGAPWCYDTEVEAREQFERMADAMAERYRVERNCVRRRHRRSAYVSLLAWNEVADEDGDTWADGVEVLDEHMISGCLAPAAPELYDEDVPF